MGKRTPKSRKSGSEVQELVVVAVVEDWDQAKEYEALLKNDGIPVIIRERKDDGAASLEVLVPEEHLDEAHVVIESQQAYDDFYEMAIEEEAGDLEPDFDDDDF